MSIDTAQKWELAFSKKHQKLVQTSTNLVDEVWKNQPPAEINPVIVHPLQYAGRSVADKLKDLRERLIQENARGIIISALDEVSWFGLLLYIFAQSCYYDIQNFVEHGLFPHVFILFGFCHAVSESNCYSAGCLVV